MPDNGPYVELFRRTSQPSTSPVSVSGTGDLDDYESLMVWGSTSEWRRCYTRVWHQSTFHNVYFTLVAFNGSGSNAYLKCTDFKISLNGDKWTIGPNAYNEFAGTSSKTIVNTAIGPSIVRIVGVRRK